MFCSIDNNFLQYIKQIFVAVVEWAANCIIERRVYYPSVLIQDGSLGNRLKVNYQFGVICESTNFFFQKNCVRMSKIEWILKVFVCQWNSCNIISSCYDFSKLMQYKSTISQKLKFSKFPKTLENQTDLRKVLAVRTCWSIDHFNWSGILAD